MSARRRLAPYLLLAPGLAWLGAFFVVPMYYLGYTSLQSGDLFTGYSFTWAWDNYRDAFTLYRAHFVRSLEYAGIATVVAFAVGYPLAYWIAFRAGRWKSFFLLLVIAPFFVTYLIRTLAWKTILADQGVVVGVLQDVHVLEQIDRGLIEAAEDLYASRLQAFLRVTFPLSLPGVFAGTLLTFIPAAGDFINAELLGTPRQQMIGNVIQSKFKEVADYPQAAALSFVLMAALLLAIVAYARAVGSEKVTTA